MRNRAAFTQKADLIEVKKGQTVNGHRIKKTQDVWFPNFFKKENGETETCFIYKSVGSTNLIYVHEEHYKKLKFVEV